MVDHCHFFVAGSVQVLESFEHLNTSHGVRLIYKQVDLTPLQLPSNPRSHKKYIFPKKAKTVGGDWRYVVNTAEYEQGVTVEICGRGVQGE